MKGLWWYLWGSVRLRLVGADPEGTLRQLARWCVIRRVEKVSSLEVTFEVSRMDFSGVRNLAGKRGDRVELLETAGILPSLRNLKKYPVIALTALVLFLATLWIPTRIFFIEIAGNETLTRWEILEAAEESGLYFGCDRGALRSEQIKNRLLSALPQLSWAGVNTSGCVATITVRERQTAETKEPELPGNIVAVTDAIVTGVVVTRGTPQCAPGNAVKAGQILISGYSDLGLTTRAEAAEGEVMGETLRSVTAKIPSETLTRQENGEVFRKVSLIFGKKRINFFKDSGILYPGCGKMTQIRVLRLPGGLTLPVALVVETYTGAKLTRQERREEPVEAILRRQTQNLLLARTVAGEILEEHTAVSREGDVYCLRGFYTCREMIGRRSIGLLTEGDSQ